MNKRTLFFIVVIAGLAFWTQAYSSAAPDRNDAAATAAAVLKAYAARDLPAMAALSTADNRKIIQELIAQGENHPRWRSIFSGGRWRAVSNWKGDVGEVRYFQRAKTFEARVKFAETSLDRIVVVTLTWEGGKWCFEDVNFSSRESFEKGNKARPAM